MEKELNVEKTCHQISDDRYVISVEKTNVKKDDNATPVSRSAKKTAPKLSRKNGFRSMAKPDTKFVKVFKISQSEPNRNRLQDEPTAQDFANFCARRKFEEEGNRRNAIRVTEKPSAESYQKRTDCFDGLMEDEDDKEVIYESVRRISGLSVFSLQSGKDEFENIDNVDGNSDEDDVYETINDFLCLGPQRQGSSSSISSDKSNYDVLWPQFNEQYESDNIPLTSEGYLLPVEQKKESIYVIDEEEPSHVPVESIGRYDFNESNYCSIKPCESLYETLSGYDTSNNSEKLHNTPERTDLPKEEENVYSNVTNSSKARYMNLHVLSDVLLYSDIQTNNGYSMENAMENGPIHFTVEKLSRLESEFCNSIDINTSQKDFGCDDTSDELNRLKSESCSCIGCFYFGVRPLTQTIINGHTVDKICIVKPVWCILCEEYIWGGGKISLICSGCRLCAHAGCHQLFNSYRCAEVKEIIEVKPKAEILKPLYDWMPAEVLEWLVAARLHPYINNIAKWNLFGKDMNKITKEFLKESGVQFDLHIDLFMLCVEELMKPPPTAEQLSTPIPLTESNDITTHMKIHDHTFTTHQKCHICGKPFFGVFRQGLMCDACGLQCHRPCAFSMTNRQCAGGNMSARRSSVSEDPSFCCNFKSTDIPPVLRKCVESIEQKGLHIPHVYQKDVPYDQFQALKSALNQNAENVNMNEEYWRDAGCAAHILKTFLLELPMPLFPTNRYDEMTSALFNGTITQSMFSEIWKSLPDSNRCHLSYLLKHLINLANESDRNQMTIERIAETFSFLIIRPPENEAGKFVMNMKIHEDAVTYLIDFYDNWEKENDKMTSDIESGEWLWHDGTRKDVSQCLQCTPDGTFLVRPSETRSGEWTLTVRKEGKNRLIKIITRDGLFGFREDLLRFSSLYELVNHFCNNSLKDYNEKLDIRLKYPCAKPEKHAMKENTESDLKERFEKVSERLHEIKCIEFKVEEEFMLLEDCKQLCESQKDVVDFIEEQIKLSDMQFKEVSNQDKRDLLESLNFLTKLKEEEKRVEVELNAHLSGLSNEYNLLKAQFTELSTDLPLLREEYNQLEPKMKDIQPELFKQGEEDNIEPSSYYDHLPSVPSQRSSGDLQESSWLCGHLDKSEISRILENKPNGTFLVRKSRSHPYAISLVHDNQIKHIPILRGAIGFGFAEPYNTYHTLHDLINHYHNTSLRLHNRTLDTTLRIPYKFLEYDHEPIYD